MKNFILGIFFLILFQQNTFANDNNLIKALNSYNINKIEQTFLGYQYDSHGCFHFYPRDIYVLYRIIPKGSLFIINNYKKNAPIKYKRLPLLASKISSTRDIKYYQNLFTNKNFEAKAFPKDDLWVIFHNKKPLFKIKTIGGPKKNYYLSFGADTNKKITFEKSLAHQTTPGTYYFWGGDKDFYTPYYNDTTLLPIGSKISQQYNGSYVYEKKGKTYPLPKSIKEDMKNQCDILNFKYYDIKQNKEGRIKEAKWCSNDFGKYVIYWSRDKKSIRSEIGYATGDLLYEEIIFLQDLANALAKGSIKFNKQEFISSFSDYNNYLSVYDFLYNQNSDINIKNYDVNTYLKMMYRIKVSYKDWEKISPIVRAAYKKYHFPDTSLKTDELKALKKAGISTNIHKIRGIERELNLYKISMDKLLLKFNYLIKEADYYENLSKMFHKHFAKNTTLQKRQEIIYNLLQKRAIYSTLKQKDLK